MSLKEVQSILTVYYVRINRSGNYENSLSDSTNRSRRPAKCAYFAIIELITSGGHNKKILVM